MKRASFTQFPLSIKQCRIIQAIAHKRSESDASVSLHLTQSSVSRALASAEKTLGCKLFFRGWGGSDLTTEGEIVVSHCNTIIKEISRAEQILSETATRHPVLRPHLEWRHLKILDTVVKLGSASAAANQLNISQPAVSRTLKELENMVRQPLFVRLRLGLEPTETATLLASLNARTSPCVQGIPQALAALPGHLTGRLSVGMLPFSSQDIVPKAFGILSNEHPHLRLQALPAPYHMLSSALRQGEIDCYLGLLRSPSPYAELVEHPLMKARYYLVARADHKIHRRAKDLSDLTNQKWVVARHGTPIRAYFESLFDSIGSKPPVQTLEMLTFDSSEQMIIHSDAVALLFYDQWHLRKLNPSLKIIDIDLPDAQCTIGITLHKERIQPSVTKFIEVLEEIIEKR